jgi:hypothetical protein
MRAGIDVALPSLVGHWIKVVTENMNGMMGQVISYNEKNKTHEVRLHAWWGMLHAP